MEEQKNNNGESNLRKVDLLAEETNSWWKNTYLMVQKTKVRTWKAIFVVAFFAGATSATVWGVSLNIQNSSMAAEEAALYLDPPSLSYDIGEDVNLDVLLDTKNNNIVAAKVVILYNPIHFSLESWTTNNSAFFGGNACQYQGKACEIIKNDPNKGEIIITVAKPTPGINSSSATIASLKFKALAPINPDTENITISYLGNSRYDDSDVIIDNGGGMDVLSSAMGARVGVGNPICSAFTYSEWGACQSNGTQTRTVSSSTPEGCTGGSPALEQNCTFTLPTCTAFTYSDWSACQPNGEQSRTVASSTPAGCTGGEAVLTQNCQINPIPITCATFTYSDWGACQPNSEQSRMVASNSPAGCTGGNPILTQNCHIDPGPSTCTAFTYSNWQACQPNGQQNRTVVSSSPSGCTGGNPTLTQNCTFTLPTCTAFTYSDWSACQPNGEQSRTVASSTPAGCTGGEAVLTQNCQINPIPITCTTFTYSDWGTCQPNGEQSRKVASNSPSGCTGGNPALKQSCTVAPAECKSFTYSDWSACQPNGMQTRTVRSLSPSGCTGGKPILEQRCKIEETETSCKSFKYSDWSACQPDGTKSRTVVSKLPKGCEGGTPKLAISCLYSTNTPPKKDKPENKFRPKLKFTSFLIFLNKGKGDKVWWKVNDPDGVDHYSINFNKKKTETKDGSFILPSDTPKGLHVLKVEAFNKAGETALKRILVRIK